MNRLRYLLDKVFEADADGTDVVRRTFAAYHGDAATAVNMLCKTDLRNRASRELVSLVLQNIGKLLSPIIAESIVSVDLSQETQRVESCGVDFWSSPFIIVAMGPSC